MAEEIDALEELHADGVPLVDVSGAFLQGIDLGRANLLRANFRAADVRGCNASLCCGHRVERCTRSARFGGTVLTLGTGGVALFAFRL